MTPLRLLLLLGVALTATTAQSQIFTYEDLDPDETSPVGGMLPLVGGEAGGRTGVGIVDLGGIGDPPFMSLITDPQPFDVSSFIGEPFSAAAEVFIPASSPINTGDSIYLTVDYYNAAMGNVPGSRIRSNNGFYSSGSPRDTWLPLGINGAIPALTEDSLAIDSANVSVVITDGGFGGTPDDATPGDFVYLDNFSYVVSPPPNPVFFSNDAPSSANMNAGNVLFEPAVDPNDASNDVGELILGGLGTFVNVNIGSAVNVSAFEGQKFRASFDYLVPADTALEPDDDTFWVQVAFDDPASASTPQGAGNSSSLGFPNVANVADGVWRTIELTGVIPPDTGTAGGSGGATMQITLSDDGFAGGPADTFGTAMFIDNVVFEALETLEGDYNNDGVVDAADYTVYRDNLGDEAPVGPPYAYRDAVQLSGERDINFSGDGANGVTTDDLAVWAGNYGAAAAASGGAIPEPTAALLLLCGVTTASLRRDGVARRSEAV